MLPGNGPSMSPTQERDPQIEPQLIFSQEGVPADETHLKVKRLLARTVGTGQWMKGVRYQQKQK